MASIRTGSTHVVAQTDVAKTPADSVSVGSSDTVLVATNPARVSIYVSNTHATQDVYLSLGGAAASGKGIYLKAAQPTPLRISDYTGAINAYASGAATVVTFSEV